MSLGVVLCVYDALLYTFMRRLGVRPSATADSKTIFTVLPRMHVAPDARFPIKATKKLASDFGVPVGRSNVHVLLPRCGRVGDVLCVRVVYSVLVTKMRRFCSIFMLCRFTDINDVVFADAKMRSTHTERSITTSSTSSPISINPAYI